MSEYTVCKEKRWYIFLISSAVVEIIGILSALIYRLCLKLSKCLLKRNEKNKNRKLIEKSKVNNEGITVTISEDYLDQTNIDDGNHENKTSDFLINSQSIMTDSVFTAYSPRKDKKFDIITEAKDWAGEIISGQNPIGRILISLVSILSLGSLIIFFIEVRNMNESTNELCIRWSDSSIQHIDVAFNIVFLVFFVLRWVASQDKLWFWFEIYSIVDVITIPPVFLTLIVDRYWIGLRFTRAIRLTSITDVLVFLNILRSSSKIRLCHLITIFLSLVLTSSGFIHLIELSGDFPENENETNKTYFDYVYFMIVTMSTVGYGDIFCKTWLGKLIMIFFILGGLAIFANSIPEIIEIINNQNQYGGSIKKAVGKEHIILCGHITSDTVSNFLADFLHKDREDVDVQIAILDNCLPDIQLQSVLKRNINKVQFLQGTVMNTNDLARVHINQANACLVLSDKYSMDPDAEDAANIMRVISIKNTCPNIKVIVQLMQYHNKAYLMNIPSWDWRRGDDVICIAEFKLGFLAQSCLAPGFSTLLANLFAMRSYKNNPSLPNWVNQYVEGASLEMYTEYLSPSFHGLTFSEAVCVCFTKLKLLLIAIEIKADNKRNNTSSIAINPKPDIRIEVGTQGFFIAESADNTKRAFYYCHLCHAGKNYKLIKACTCQKNQRFQQTLYNIQSSSWQMFQSNIQSLPPRNSIVKPKVVLRNRRKRLKDTRNYDSTSSLTENNFDNIRFNEQSFRRFDSTGMFHWCPDKDYNSVILSKKDNISSIVFSNHIIVCIFADTEGPLIGLRNFIMPLRSSNYHFNEIQDIIFVGSQEYIKREWKSIMNFPKIYIQHGSPMNRENLRLININLCEMTVILSTTHVGSFSDSYLTDKEVILCSLNIKAMDFTESTFSNKDYDNILNDNLTSSKYNVSCFVPMITELSVDASVQYLDQDDEDNPKTELFLTQPFACGRAFTVSVLDSLMSTAYFNENALTLIRAMVTGGATPELEELLAEGSGFQGAYLTPETLVNRDRCRVETMRLDRSPFKGLLLEENLYGSLFIKSLKTYGILCIGLYRSINNKAKLNAPKLCNDRNRFVITNPSSDTPIFEDDWIFCLRPFNLDLYINQIHSSNGEKNNNATSIV